ncbi:SDR family NAD(P)-dependent oxidoreductase [Streptomyces tendae]|uniref:SDR family NAD(P)-dependent oxidoreductase n=1 Tax=Streptomyces tendae TaxID=1932 RepID=UPI00342795D9
MNDPIECHLSLPHDDFIMQNHRIHQVSVMPGATFLDIVYRILRAQDLDTERAALRDVLFAEPMATAVGRDLAVRVTIGAPDATGARPVEAAGAIVAPGTDPATAESDGIPWRPHFSARLEFTDEPPPPPVDPRALLTRARESRDMAELYRQARTEDIEHGPPMKGFGELHLLDTGGLLARLELDPASRDQESAFHLHPAKLDAATLVTFGHRPPPGPDPFIPVHIARFRAPRAVTGPCWVHVPTAETLAPSGDLMHNDCLVYDEQGRFVAEFTKLSCKRVRHAGLITRLLDTPPAAPEQRPRPAAATGGDPEQRLAAHLRTLIGGLLGRTPDAVDPHRGFYEIGLGSVTLLALSTELEKAVDGRLYPTLLFEYPDVASVARHLAQRHTVTLPAEHRPAAAPGAAADPAPAQSPPRPATPPASAPGLGLHRPRWVPRAATPAPQPSGDLLVVTADPALPDALRRHRAASGRRTVHVLPAPAYERTGTDTWHLPTGSRADFGRLLDELAAEGAVPTVLAVSPTPAPGPAADTTDAYDVVWALAGALAARPADTTRELRFLYRADHEDAAPQHAAIGALARGITAENPALRCRSTCVVGAPYAEELADVLLAEAADGGEDSESMHRHGERHVRRLIPHTLDGPDTPALPRGAVCLVTGGAGGIGSLLAEHLAGTHGARLVLCGTRPADAATAALLDRCAARGGEAHYLRADVSRPEDAAAVAARCRELYGRIDAVLHCAGRTDDALHFRRDPAETHAVLAPKLAGTLHLDRATADSAPALFVLFSSLSAVVPNTGQCAYGYANAFLDAFAGHRAADPARTGRTLSLAWPYWAEGGMRADAAALARSAESGMRPLPTGTALGLLDRCLARPDTPARLVAVHTEGNAAGPLTTGLFAPAPDRAAPAPSVPVAAHTPATFPARGRSTRPVPEPVAIVGVAGRYPQAADLDAFWANLAAGRDCVTEVPPDRWDHDALFDPEPGRPGRTYGRWGGFLAGMDRFDPLFFGISRREAERMDPQERLFLTIAWQTLEDAGHPPESLTAEQVGVFAGVMWNHFQFVPDPDDEAAPVALHSSVANRVSYTFDFRGPSIAVDTACSSSLTALHLAVESLRRGESTCALAGGVNLMPHPQKYLQLARGRWLSRDGRCRAFGEGGTGYVPGEGVGAVLLKPLDRALADGDHVHGVIRSARVNHSGRTSGFTVPSPTAQAALVADAVRESGADVRDLGYVEAHGTGTSLGDPIELDGLRNALATFSPGPEHVAIGSVKTNIGHLESAAGIAGLTKVLLQFRHGVLAPSLHADTLNPHLDFGDGRLAVQRGAAPWPRPSGGRRLAGISAFGAGGSNAHVVLEEPPAVPARPAPRGPRLFVLSAKDEEALRERAAALLALLTPDTEGPGGAVAREPAPIRSLVARRLAVPEASLGGGETFEDLGLDPAGRLALAHDLAAHTETEQAIPATEFAAAVHSGTTLEEAAETWADLTVAAGTGEHGPPRLDDLAHTLRVGRTAMPVRFAVVADGLPELRAALEGMVKGAEPGPRAYRGSASADVRPPARGAAATAGTLEDRARRWVTGDTDDAEGPDAGPPARRVPLPGYPFREESCWPGGWTGRPVTDREAAPAPGPVTPAPVPAERTPDTSPAAAPHPAPALTASSRDDGAELVVLDGGIGLIRMNSPMFTERLLDDLRAAFDAVAVRTDVKAVVITGSDGVFSMGGTAEALETLADGEGRFTDQSFVYEGLLRCDRPVVAAIDGHASGGGLAFGLYADVVLLAEESVYSANFVAYGFTPGMGATYVLERRFGSALADEMMLTGRSLSGAELHRHGAMVTVLPRGEVLPAALDRARELAARPEGAVRRLKQELAGRVLARLDEVVGREVRMHEEVLGTGARDRVRGHFARVEAFGRPGDTTARTPGPARPPEPSVAPAGEAAPEAVAGPSEAEVRADVVASLVQVLYLRPEEIDDERTFAEMGLDSIGAVEVVRHLNERYGAGLEAVSVYDHPTVPAMTTALLSARRRTAALHRAALEPAVRAEDDGRDTGAGGTAHGPTPAPEPAPPAVPVSRPVPPAPGTAVPATPTTPAGTVTLRPVPRRSPAGTKAVPGEEERSPDPEPEPAGPPDGADVARADIAVIGMSGRFPGADDLDTFWRNLEAGRSEIAEVPPERWCVDRWYDPDRSVTDRTDSKWAALVRAADEFDPAFFRLSPLEAEAMDPQQRLFLQEAWRALEDAGHGAGGTDRPTERGTRDCGVFVGCGAGDYADLLAAAGQADTGHAFLGSSPSVLASRISYFLDLTGPTLAVDTACSSSLTAVHLACESLRRGECRTALAGGVALMFTPRLHIRCSNAGMLSPSGTSAPFDARADGIVLGEGVGVVVLKPLARALADGDHIHGVIKATGVNGDGRTNGMTAPSAAAQTELLRRVHHAAGVTAADIGYVEAHGTGTPLGDPIEVKALQDAFRPDGPHDPDGPDHAAPADTAAPTVLGSVKANIGHTTMAAGVAGLLKVLLALRHRRIPPTPHFSEANPEIDLSRGPFRVLTGAVDWHPGPRGTRIATLSSFGFSGTNAHAVIAEAPPRPPAPAESGRARLIPVSARDRNALGRALTGLADALEAEDAPALADIALTLGAGRTHFPLRAALVVRDRAELVRALRDAAACREAPYVYAPGTAEPSLRSLAETYAHGGSVDWAALNPHGAARRVPLPTYPFARDRHWLPGAGPDTGAPHRPEDAPGTLTQALDPRDRVVADHRLAGRSVLPGVAGLSLAVRAAARHGITGAVRVSRVQWLRPVEAGAVRDVRVTTKEDPAGGVAFELTAADGARGVCVRGRVEPLTDAPEGPLPVEAVRERCPSWHPGKDLYAAFAAGDLAYGPAYQALEGVWAGTDEALGVLRAPDTPAGEEASWPLDPAVLDAALQTLTVLVRDTGDGPLVPFALRALEVRAPLPARGHAHAVRDGATFTVRVSDPAGRVCASFLGVALRPLPTADDEREPAAGRPETVVLVPRLREAGPPDRAGSPDEGTTWVFHTPAARPLAGALAGAGRPVTTVALPATGGTASLAVPDGVPDTVYWLALHDPDEPVPVPGPDPATLGLFRLLKTLLGRGAGSRRLALKVALSGAVADEERGPVQPHSAGLIGLTRSAAAEYPKWRAGCVDLPPEPPAPGESADLLLAEPCTEPLVVLRGPRRLVRDLAQLPVPRPAGPGKALRDDGAYVVIGGTGGIGTALARHLARHHRARLVLVGRRPQDDSVRALLAELDALGGQTAYVRGDVADPADARRIVAEARERTGRVDGVFHSALVLRDRTLAAMDEDTFLDVLAAKTSGLTALAAALDDEPPGFLVCFSSAVSFTDAPGQANYAAASTFEDAFAGYLRERSFPASVINWGFWGSVGVVAQQRRVERFAELGIGSLDPAEGIDALTRALGADLAQAVVVKADRRGLALLGAEPDGTTDALARARAGFAELERVAASLLRARLPGADGDPETVLARWSGRNPEGGAGERLLRAVVDLLRRSGPGGPSAQEVIARHPGMRPHVTLLRRCVEALPEVLDGSRPPTDVLFPEGSVDLVESVYRGQPLSDHHHRLMAAQTLAALSRHRSAGGGRPLRILEIGAGTGAGTAFVLDALDDALEEAAHGTGSAGGTGGAPPVSYTYTDVSSAFLAHGEREFGSGRPHLSFRILDIERPPAAQDFTPHGYDLVLATNVLHATADVGRTLAHVRELLSPGGTLLVNEVTRASDFLTLTFGLTPGWWAFRDAERRLPHTPLLGPDQWHRALTAGGFGPVRTLGVPDTPVERLDQCVFVARTAPEPVAPKAEPDGARVRAYVRDVFAEVLKFDAGALADEVTFDNYGVDSLVSLRIVSRFEEDFGELPATLLFQRLTIARLADYFAEEHPAAVVELLARAGARPETPVAAGTPAPDPRPLPGPDLRPLPAPAVGGDIAVIGVGGRYPGAPDLDTFWHNIASGTSSFSEVPAERWDWRPTFDARRGTPQHTYSRWGAFLDGIDRFDPAFFGILGRDAAHIDPQERLFLETAWNLLEENGHLGPDTHDPDTGVFVGVMYGTYGQLAATGWPRGRLSGAHSAHWSVANRVSYFFDFQGPSLSVDSACSSSLTAVHLACESLRRGECRTALAGGVNLILHPAHHVSLSALNMLSADGRCKVFDADADGFVPGEGVGAVLLKPLDRAVADGDRIWAVIKGGAMNAGGRTGGYTVPNPNAQAALVRRVLERTGVPPETVSYVECHGTGTSLGDPIEIAALGKAFGAAPRSTPCAVGSVKSNIGHLEGAAGIAGLTKLLLQLRHRRLAPCVNLDTPNPRIDFATVALEPVTTLTDWPAPPDGTPRRAGVSSFGAGGANTHLILEEYHRPDTTAPEATGPQLFLLSARSAERLRVYARRVADHLAGPDGAGTALAALARTSQTGRRHFPERLAVVCADTDRLAVLLRSFADTGRAEIPGLVVGRAAPGRGERHHGTDSALLRDARGTDPAQALARLGGRWASGDDVDWAALWEGSAVRRVPYPTYPFDRTRHWLDTGVADPTMGGTTTREPVQEAAGTPRPPSREDGAGALHRLVPTLEPCPQDVSAPVDPPRRVLLLGPDSAVRRALAEEFDRRGAHCIAVSAGEPGADGAGPATPDALRRFVHDLGERDLLPDTLVLACPPEAGPPGPGTVADDLDRGPHPLLWTAAALLARDRRVRLRTAVAHGPAVRQPQFSATGALLKSLALEHSGCAAVALAFETYEDAAADTATAARFAEAVADELEHCGDGVTEVVHDRDGRRHLRRLTERPVPPGTADAPLPVRAGGTYLVTGGAGALGRILGGLLADTAPVNLVLAGRSPLDDGIERRTAELWRGGSTVWYRRTDLSSATDVAGLIADIRGRYGTLNGIVHAAGVHRDARAVVKTAAESAEVLGPKVAGTVLLDHATRDEDLDFYVLCASLVGETGNLGQTDYAYANAFQMDFAEGRERLRAHGERPGRTVAIGWPLWEDGGMDVDDATRRLFAQLWSMAPLRTGTGLAAFRAALTGTGTRWLPVERLPVERTPAERTPVPRPPSPATHPTTPAEPSAGYEREVRTDTTSGARHPGTDAPIEAVRRRLRAFTAEFLLVDPDEVDTAAELMDLGFDSISLSELIVRVNDHYGLELLPTVLFEHPTLDDVAAHLSREHPAEVSAVDPVPAPAVDPDPAPAAPAAPRNTVVRDGPEPVAPARSPAAAPASRRRDVAVIGMAGRLPGSPDLDAFWRHLSAGDDLVGPVPADRADLLADATTAGLRGGFLADVADFDAAFFRISPAEARLMDPQHRLFLETVWRTFEDAGHRPEDRAGTSTGVFVGMATSDYGELIARSGADPEAHMATGVARSLVANRVSHLLDLRGPSETVDTACSSSLVALHRAVGAVAGGECDEAIAGGVSLALSPGLFRVFDQSGMLSPAGRCRTFDKDADGYVRGEGVGAVLLKPLERAEADGDRILAVVRGTAVNHCGRSPSLTAPNPRAQADVVVRAHRAAGVSPSTVTYIETHGTGTRLGDPIETEGLKDAFTRLYGDSGEPVPADPHITLGSVKTNIGHLEAAAGIAGLLKVLLALRHRTLPAHLHLRETNPYLRLDGTPFRIGTTTTPWEGAKDEHGRPSWRAGVSSFGFGGTNAHVVLEAWTPPDDAPRPAGRAQALPRAEFQPRRHWFSAPAAPRPTRTESLMPHPEQAVTTTHPQLDANPAPATRPRVRLQPLGATAPAVPEEADPEEVTPADVASEEAASVRPTPQPRVEYPAEADTAPPAAPATAAAGPSVTEIRATVRGLVADVLGLSAADLAHDTPFADLGLDSIFRMDVARALNDRHGLDLQGAELYEYDTIAALADHVLAAIATGAPRPGPREIPPPPAPDGRDDARDALRQVLEEALGRPFDPAVTFEDNGFTSFDMLRGVSALEAGIGALPKALLFERPTLDRLTDYLCETHGEQAVARVRPPAPQETPAPAPGPATGARTLTRTEVAADPELGPVVAELERRYGKESGLGGRNIAPHLFVGAERRGLFALSKRDRALLVWNYTGPEDHFAELAAEYFDHARRTGLRPNLLSLVRLAEVGGEPVTATPFGALQRIEDLGSFTLSGGRMSRLRYMVKRFEKAGACRTVEYRSGDDPAVDAELAALVDGWAATKQMVNPYVRRVREELAGGRLDERHRLFLTYLDDALVNAVVVTRIASENGYLLDVEFYPGHMPLGGLEFALVRILERLREEGCEVFSFGASFGGEPGTSPNASEAAVRALSELRDAGIFGGGNYQFKNKFRPENRTLYLVQPEGDGASEVSDVILMIADPATPAAAATPAPREPDPDLAPRAARLSAHGHNPVRLPHLAVELDLITDSWADRADPWQRARTRTLGELADAVGVTGEEPPAVPWLPFAHRFFAASGRAAEERVCRAWPGPRGRVLHASAFPTWLGALTEHGFDPSIALPVVGEGPCAADLRLTALEDALDRYAGQVSFVLVETATNAHGGAPLSLENLRGVAERTRASGVPLLVDATRLLDNALLVSGADPGRPARDPWEVVREMLGLAQTVTFSLSKDFGVDGGGLIATADERLAERLTERMLERGREPGLSARRLLSAALLDQESTTRLVTERVANVAAFRQRLELGGVPLVPGPSAHCVLLDVDKAAAGSALRHPVASYLAGIYAATGVRGGPHLTPGARLADGSAPQERHLIRLAVPLGMDRETLERGADRIAALVAAPAPLPDLTEVTGTPGPAALRTYHPTDALPTDIREALEEGPAPATTASANHDVLRERAPGVRRHLLPMADGTVEVFDCGSGPAVLMLPPFNIGGGVFADQVAGLSDRHRALVVHHPGVGATTTADDISLPGIADLYVDVLDRLDVQGPVHVVGTSFGGLLAQSFVLAHPGRAASLALVCSSYRYANRVGEVNRLADLVAEDLDRIVAAGAEDVARHRAEYTERLLRCESMAPHIGLRYLDVFAQQPDLLGRLADIAVPTLVVAGGVDAVVPRKTSHLMHGAIPDARYHELPLAGHFPTVTDPDGVTAALAAFLAELGEER